MEAGEWNSAPSLAGTSILAGTFLCVIPAPSNQATRATEAIARRNTGSWSILSAMDTGRLRVDLRHLLLPRAGREVAAIPEASRVTGHIQHMLLNSRGSQPGPVRREQFPHGRADIFQNNQLSTDATWNSATLPLWTNFSRSLRASRSLIGAARSARARSIILLSEVLHPKKHWCTAPAAFLNRKMKKHECAIRCNSTVFCGILQNRVQIIPDHYIEFLDLGSRAGFQLFSGEVWQVLHRQGEEGPSRLSRRSALSISSIPGCVSIL